MKKVLSLDIKFSLTQILFFGSYCALLGYSSVYLLDKGFDNSTIGTILAVVSAIGVFTQPMIATFADRSKKISLNMIISVFLAAACVLTVGMYFMKSATIFLIFMFVAICTCVTAISPLVNSLAFMFEKHGIQINYGVARGLGSAAYAFVSMAIGYLVEDFGASIIPLLYLVFNILLIVVVQLYVVPKSMMEEVTNAAASQEVVEEEEQLSFIDFCMKYKKFMFFVFGTVLVFFTHTIVNNFFIQIITPIGGTEKQMGTAIFLAAILELPTMSAFEVIRKKVGVTNLLVISAVFFALKHTVAFLATDMTMIYIGQVLQIGAYAIFMPASVYYANQLISKKDLVKGQAMVTVGYSASGIIANIIGGVLLDALGVHDVLLIGVVVSFIAAVVIYIAVKSGREKDKKETLYSEGQEDLV